MAGKWGRESLRREEFLHRIRRRPATSEASARRARLRPRHAAPTPLRSGSPRRKALEGERIAALPGVAILSDQEMVTVGVMCRAIPQDIDESFGDEDSLIGCRTVQFLN